MHMISIAVSLVLPYNCVSLHTLPIAPTPWTLCLSACALRGASEVGIFKARELI